MSQPIAVDESTQHLTLRLQDTTPHIQMGLVVHWYPNVTINCAGLI